MDFVRTVSSVIRVNFFLFMKLDSSSDESTPPIIISTFAIFTHLFSYNWFNSIYTIDIFFKLVCILWVSLELFFKFFSPDLHYIRIPDILRTFGSTVRVICHSGTHSLDTSLTILTITKIEPYTVLQISFHI